jgi:hypothetical protein
MSVRVTGGSIVVRNEELDAKYVGGIEQALADGGSATRCSDGVLTAVTFRSEPERLSWVGTLRSATIGNDSFALFDAIGSLASPAHWLEIEQRADGTSEAWLRGRVRGELAAIRIVPHTRYELLEPLSTSPSGLHYVRERKSGAVRLLTDAQLLELSDPRPCEECGEQFGCEHYNCAGERLLSEGEIAAEVPRDWRRFALLVGISRGDVGRLEALRLVDGEYRADAAADLRAHELAVLLNG